ncbi:DNA alkylation repair enzyme [uncultured archaeon]|nr:DNA alkylation repair enzyme [uncultured archaeon]
MLLFDLRKELRELADPEKAKLLQGFFKTGKGEYGEGDIFSGITVPESRKIAKRFLDLSFSDLQILLNSKKHEERFIALLILSYNFEIAEKKGNDLFMKQIYGFFMKNTEMGNINNWDLVDVITPKIVGKYLLEKDRLVLYELVRSNSLWKKRIAILATFWFIKNNDFKDSLNFAKELLDDEHDLIHKAVGWMLREVGKRDEKVLKEFLKKYYKKMPRTMLRYSIEKFDEKTRQKFLAGKI